MNLLKANKILQEGYHKMPYAEFKAPKGIIKV